MLQDASQETCQDSTCNSNFRDKSLMYNEGNNNNIYTVFYD